MRVVLCNCSPDKAGALARALVADRLAACVNLLGSVQSVYRWAGEICEEPEITLVIKTSEDRLEALKRQIIELHPYDVPEILALPVDVEASHAPYVAWVRAETQTDQTPES